MKKQTIGVYEFARRTGMELSAVYKALYLGKIAGRKEGGMRRQVWRIPESEVEKNMGASQ